MEDAVLRETNPTPTSSMPGTMPVLCRHGGTDGSDRLIDGCQTQPGRQVQRFKEWACDPRRRSSAVITSTNGSPVLAMPPPKTISRGSTDWAKIWIVSPMARTTMSSTSTASASRFSRDESGRASAGRRWATRTACRCRPTISKHPYCPRGAARRSGRLDMAHFAGRTAIAMHQHAVFDNARQPVRCRSSGTQWYGPCHLHRPTRWPRRRRRR